MKNMKFYLVMLILGFSFISCEDYLEKIPYEKPVQDNFWKTQNDVEKGLSGAYALMRLALNDKVAYYTYGDVPSDELIFAGYEDYDNIRRYSLNDRLNENSRYRTIVHIRDWSNFYKIIAFSNTIIDKIATIPDSEFDSAQQKENMLGEAHFIRGFTYFYMTRIWGDLSIITEYIEDPVNFPNVPRSPMEDVWSLIESDLTFANEKMTWGYNSGGKRAIRGGKGATLATLSHFYAWTGNYQGTLKATQELIANGGYTLVSGENYESIFDAVTTENIFEISMKKEDQEEFYDFGEFNIGRKTLKYPFTVYAFQAEPDWKFDVARFRNLFNVTESSTKDDTNDKRLKSVFEDIGGFVPITTKYDNVGFKFPDEQRDFYVENNIIIFRLADVLLLRAEALSASSTGNEEARILLNNIRDRAGLDPYTGDEMFKMIMEERARELWLEGHRFYDMVRYKRHDPSFSFPFITDGDFASGKYYWPVEPLLRTNDPALEQTEFWKSKF